MIDPSRAYVPAVLIEQRFGFESPAFETYMGVGRTHGIEPAQLANEAEAMTEHEHPLVRYAAGWAYAERGIYKGRPAAQHKSEPPEVRLDALDKAEALWADTQTPLADLQRQIPDEKLAADAWGFYLRLRQAQVYLPNMRLIARLRGHEAVPTESIQATQQQTRQNTVRFGATILSRQPQNTEEAFVLNGMRNEITAGLLLQQDRSSTHTMFAASVRQDHRSHERYRADLVAASITPQHTSTLVGISSRGNRADIPRRLNVDIAKDLVLEPGGSIRHTLGVAIAVEHGHTIKTENRTRLHAVAAALGIRLIKAQNTTQKVRS